MKSLRGVPGAVLGITLMAACASADLATDAAPPDAACVPVAERCNGIDDDCDGAIDEGFDGLAAACSVGEGACAQTGIARCSDDGLIVACDAVAGTGAVETCNGVDDDCDGTIDEGFGLGGACDGDDADLCAEGTMICDALGNPVCSDLTGDNLELCNGADDDCDGAIDEGLGLGDACDGDDGDQCLEGIVICDGAGGTTCSDLTGTITETCNGLDDDCDGVVDNGYGVGVACSAGIGACNRPGQQVCNGAGTGVICDAVAGSPTAEYCGDGIDQDCNGADVSCPINDAPAGAINISAGGTFTVDMVAALDHRRNSCSNGGAGGRDVYYTFTLPAAEVVYLDTFGSNFDTTVAIMPGTCTAATTETVCVDDGCSVGPTQLATSLAAGTYCVVVDQYYGSAATTGALVLTFHRAGRTGIAIPASSGSRTGNTCSATNQSVPPCESTSTGRDVGYFFLSCPSTTRTVGANTCTSTSWDTVVYTRHSPGVTVAGTTCNDDGCGATTPFRQSTFSGATVSGGGLNWLIVDGYGTGDACGAYTLTYTIQ